MDASGCARMITSAAWEPLGSLTTRIALVDRSRMGKPLT